MQLLSMVRGFPRFLYAHPVKAGPFIVHCLPPRIIFKVAERGGQFVGELLDTIDEKVDKDSLLKAVNNWLHFQIKEGAVRIEGTRNTRKPPRFLFSNPANTKSDGPFVIHSQDPKLIFRIRIDEQEEFQLIPLDKAPPSGMEEVYKEVWSAATVWLHYQVKDGLVTL